MMKYLIVKCIPLNDGWECDADRKVYLVTDNWKKALPKKGLFEVYEISNNGKLHLIKDYEDSI